MSDHVDRDALPDLGVIEPGGTMTSRIADAVREAIADGRLAPGDRFSVPRLADHLGASRTPVREALLLLERQGLLRFERNRGVRVLETSLHDLEEIFTMRLLLEVPATERACALLDAEAHAALAAHLAEMRRHAEDGDEPAFMLADRAFHDVILRASGNRRLAATIGELRDLVRFRGASTVGRSRDLETILGEHEVVLAALRDGDAPGAAEAMRAHVAATGALLLAQEADGEPQELVWARLHATGVAR